MKHPLLVPTKATRPLINSSRFHTKDPNSAGYHLKGGGGAPYAPVQFMVFQSNTNPMCDEAL